MMLSEGNTCTEIAELARKIRKSKEADPRAVITRAIKRGELPKGSDPKTILDVLFSVVQHYVLFTGEPCDDRRIAQVIDLVLAGAENGGARPVKSAARRRAPRDTAPRRGP